MPAAWDAAQSIRSTVDSIKQSQHYTKCTFTSPLWTFSKYWQLGLVFNALEKIGKAEVFIPSLNILGASCQESHLLLTCKPSTNICCGSADYRQLVSCTNCNMYFYILKVGQASCILFPDCQNIDPRYQFLCPTCHQFNRKGALLYWVQSLAAVSSASPSKPRPLSAFVLSWKKSLFSITHLQFSQLSYHGTHKTAQGFVIYAPFSYCPIWKIILTCSLYCQNGCWGFQNTEDGACPCCPLKALWSWLRFPLLFQLPFTLPAKGVCP